MRMPTWTGRAALAAVALGAGLGLTLPGAAQEREPEETGEREVTEGEDEAREREEARERRLFRVADGFAFRFGGGAWLGVGIEDVDAEVVEEAGLPEERGAVITEVVEDGPAAEAGLREGDIIWTWNGEPVQSVAELQRLVRETPAGRTVHLELYRDGTSRELRVELDEREDAGFQALRRFEPRMEGLERRLERMGPRIERLRERFEHAPGMRVHVESRLRVGVQLRDLTPGLAEYFGVAGRGGALVADVAEDSPAARAGLQAGDVVVSVGGEEVEDPRDVVRALGDREAGSVEVRVVRRGEERTLTVELRDDETRGGWEGSWQGSWDDWQDGWEDWAEGWSDWTEGFGDAWAPVAPPAPTEPTPRVQAPEIPLAPRVQVAPRVHVAPLPPVPGVPVPDAPAMIYL